MGTAGTGKLKQILKDLELQSPRDFKYTKIRHCEVQLFDMDEDDCWYNNAWREKQQVALFRVLKALYDKMPHKLFIDIIDGKRYQEYNFVIPPNCNYILQLVHLKHLLAGYDVSVLDVFTYDYENLDEDHYSTVELEEFCSDFGICETLGDGDHATWGAAAEELRTEIQRAEERHQEDDPHICSICLDRPKNTLLGCGHLFCDECLVLQARNVCALCRKPIAEKFLLRTPDLTLASSTACQSSGV